MKRLLPLCLLLTLAPAIGFAQPAAAPAHAATQAPSAPATKAAKTAPATASANAATPAAEMLRSLPNASGLAVCIGWSDGVLPAQLAEKSGFILHILVRDAAQANTARKFLDTRALTGRASAELWTGPALPYLENTVNLLVLEDASAVAPAERQRVLAPGGVAWIHNAGAWSVERKARPAAFDVWTHWRHGADGNMVSQDKSVSVPSGVRWIASPPPWIVDNTGGCDLGMVTAGGRNYYNLKDTLVARDAYNGTLLWSRALNIPLYKEPARVNLPNQGQPKRPCRVQPVAVGDELYVVSGHELIVLDGATGATRRTLGTVMDPYDMLIDRGRLVVSHGQGIRAYDLASGKLAWEKPVKTQRLTAGDGGLFCVSGGQAVCLEIATGEERWRSREADAALAGSYTYHDGVLVLEKSTLLFKFVPKGCGLIALSARDGSTLWKNDYAPKQTHNQEARALFAQGLIWINAKDGLGAQLLGLDPRTGQVRKSWGGSGGNHCSPSIATERFFVAPECNFTDFITGKTEVARMARHACRIPFIPANGQLYTFPLQCECYPLLRGIMSLVPGPTPGYEAGEPLVRGVAAAPEVSSTAIAADEWPTYRHDVFRSGSTPAKVPAGPLRSLWQTPIVKPATGAFGDEWRANPFVPGTLTSPVAAGGIIVAAAPDVHRVIALDAATGQPRWSFTAGGRIDTPPTLHAGMCLFGAHDGWVYGLNASTGGLVWQFRAAPREAKIVAYGQVESLWPVVGSVLVDGDLAYVVAGRHPRSDGGACVYALRPRTGELVWKQSVAALPLERWYAGKLPDNSAKLGKDFKPVDVLVRDGDRIAMSRWRFDPATGRSLSAMQSVAYAALGRRVPLGLWNYGSDQTKYPLDMPETSVFDAAGMDAGKPGEVALLRAGGLHLAANKAGELLENGQAVAKLGSAAVHDGIIAAYGKVYVATQAGTLICLEGNQP